jgi:hypothetical protein
MNFRQKHLLASSGEFKNLMLMALMRIGANITFEDPADIDFGSAQQRIVDTGRLADAQREAHAARKARAQRVIDNPRGVVETAAMAMAANLVEELQRRGLAQEAAFADAVAIKIGAGEEVSAEEWGGFEQIVTAVAEHAFTAMAGFNANAWTPPAEPEV